MNSLGTQCIAARARVELACDKIREQGQSMDTKFGICDNTVSDLTEDTFEIVQTLLAYVHLVGSSPLSLQRRDLS